MSMAPLRVAVLISGTGTNLRALIHARQAGRLDLEFVQVISNREAAPGLQHAREARIPTRIVAAADATLRDREMGAALAACGAELVILAGYMCIIGPGLVAQYPGRMINLHPSLLPRYPGLDTYRRVLAAGDSEHGASVHFVTRELDAGPVIAQVRIPVHPHDNAESLAARLGPLEHGLLVATVELFTRRRVEMDSGAVLLDGRRLSEPLLLNELDQFD